MLHISYLKDFAEIKSIDKGWSEDEKYYIKDKIGNELFLRISDIQHYERKKEDFQNLMNVYETGVPMVQPLDFGVCENGKKVYLLFSWLEGNDLGCILPNLTEKEQYDLGVQAGEVLKEIHSIPAPENQMPWETRFNKKLDRKISIYKECPVKFEQDTLVLAYTEQNRRLLKGRPQTFHHGDYHCGNMILSSGGSLGIIDFNRCDYGDPWEEFNRIVWCAEISPYFASGRIDGYFHNNVPDAFFSLLALYIASNTLSSIPWAIPYGQKDTDRMLEQAAAVLRWFDSMKNPVPSWYLKGGKA